MNLRIEFILKITLLLLFSLNIFGCASNKLILPSGEKFEIDSFNIVLDNIIAEQSGRNKNIVIFVHGRGAGKAKHPEKAIEQMLPYIESEYNTKVVLFNWDGSDKGGRLGFPEKEARAASKDLFNVLTQLSKYKNENSEQLEGVHFSLLTHSLGSLVIEETIIKYFENFAPGLLDVLILSSSASQSKKHSEWLDKATLANHVFVMLNSEDGALGAAGIIRGRRLGKGLKKSETSSRAKYVDLSKTGVKHRYFIAHTKKGGKNGQKNNSCIKNFFKTALNGIPVDLDNFQEIKNVNQKNIFLIKAVTGAECG